MSSIKRARMHFSDRRLDPAEFEIGHLSDETARLYARDLFLIGYVEESKILSNNDTSRYTAIVNRVSGQPCEVFFDLPIEPEIQAVTNGGRREHSTQVPH